MKLTILLLSISLTVNLACAQARPAPVVREAKVDTCHFKFLDSYQGSLYVYNESEFHSAVYRAVFNTKMKYKSETPIRFSCEPAKAETYSNHALKQTEKGWILDTSKEEDPIATRTKLYIFKGNRWSGAGTTHDQTFGDEDSRARSFEFCIPQSLYALCGIVDEVAYVNRRNSSVLPQVIKLLESIEFIDDVNGAESKISPPLPPAN